MQREELIAKWEHNLQLLNIDGLEMLELLMGNIVESTRYTTTDEEKLRQYHEKEAAERKESAEKQAKWQAAVQERKEFEKTFKYSRNDTMRLLGHQCLCCSLNPEGDMGKQFDDIRSANRYNWNFDVAIDAFSLGLIWGKRIDRKRRKERAAKGGK